MSNPKNAIQEIKKLMVQFGFLAADPVLLSFKLEDETIIEAEKLEIGKEIFKINEAFERVILEDGSYSIEDFNVDVAEGKIVAVNENFTKATLKDGTQVVIDIRNLLAEGVDPDELKDQLGERLETLDDYIDDVDFYISVDEVRKTVQTATDQLLKNL